MALTEYGETIFGVGVGAHTEYGEDILYASLTEYAVFVVVGDQIILVSGIASLEAFGSHVVAVDQEILAAAIASAEAFGAVLVDLSGLLEPHPSTPGGAWKDPRYWRRRRRKVQQQDARATANARSGRVSVSVSVSTGGKK